jgi:rod shape-determining protein MreC
MLKRPHYIAVGLVALLTLLVLNLPGRTTARFKVGISSLFLGLFGLASGAKEVTGQAADAVLPRGELLRINETLRRENQQLRLQAQHTEEIERENARLRQLVGWQRQNRGKYKLANVILRDPANWWRTVRIDLGSRHGLSNNLPVLTAEGYLVGRIASTSLTSSQVVLLGDPNCRVSALVENEARDTGVVEAGGPFDGSLVTMTRLSRNAVVKPGQRVVTSGLGEVFPKGIPIGQIADARPAEFGLYTDAQVKLAANPGSLEEVWVLFR